MATLTPYQEQRKAERKERAMQARCAEAHAEERRLQEALRAWTKRRLAPIDHGLADDWFPHLAHNWYLVPLHYGTGGEEKLAKARRVKEVMDQHHQLQRLIWTAASGWWAWPSARWIPAMAASGFIRNCLRR